MQTTSHILMIRPVNFGYNAQTAVNNAFQQDSGDGDVQQRALREFDDFVALLRSKGVDVTVIEDTPEPYTPDSIFPNNWISFHHDGTIVLYPMFAPNRRAERKEHVMEQLSREFDVKQRVVLSGYENDGLFLEGTGSMVLDRDHHIAYACLSPRTNEAVLEDFCRHLGYRSVLFDAADGNGQAIYHTNVMMCVADRYVVICLESITNPIQAQRVIDTINDTGKQIVEITLKQMDHFAGNMLQVENGSGEKLLVMSTQAFESLTRDQVALLNSFNEIVHSSLTTIETNGGGSARCMMAELHLPKR